MSAHLLGMAMYSYPKAYPLLTVFIDIGVACGLAGPDLAGPVFNAGNFFSQLTTNKHMYDAHRLALVAVLWPVALEPLRATATAMHCT